MFSRNQQCQHQFLQLEPSPFAPLAGYSQPSHTASTVKRKRPIQGPSSLGGRKTGKDSQTFPAPLVLPHDELNYDPDEPPQTISQWTTEEERNKITSTRKKLYVARVPAIEPEVEFMSEWIRPHMDTEKRDNAFEDVESPDASLFVDYLRAFYAGMVVEEASVPFLWTSWDARSSSSRKSNIPKFIALSHNSAKIRIRVRPVKDGVFEAQLNLDDILDAVIEALPQDAYALVLLVDHDIYEKDDDDFCCGRAYGGSRVAVVQTARYNPALDKREGLDRSHMWPLSHCKTFVDALCAVEDVKPRRPTAMQTKLSTDGPMRCAVDAAASFPPDMSLAHSVRALWFSRLARTVSHELGHCFGMDHCTYFACNMQGTANMKEDVRQPPYLCSVCETKVWYAVVGELRGDKEETKRSWTSERCQALRDFCINLRSLDMDSQMWRGLDAWLEERTNRLE